MTYLYQSKTHYPKENAQRNMAGRSHYVDDDTLRFFHSRVLETFVIDGGLAFAIIESYRPEWGSLARRRRGVAWDIFGNELYRPEMNAGFITTLSARNDLFKALDNLDIARITLSANDDQSQYATEDHSRVVSMVQELQKGNKI